jgi:hypothetical protein
MAYDLATAVREKGRNWVTEEFYTTDNYFPNRRKLTSRSPVEQHCTIMHDPATLVYNLI